MKKTLLGLLFLLESLCLYSQVKASPSLSTGYISHGSTFGVNAEVGIDYEFIYPRIDLSVNLRYSQFGVSIINQAYILAASSFISYVVVNGERHRVMLGPGITVGKFNGDSRELADMRDQNTVWFNPVKLRYDYYFGKRSKIGFDFAMYGEGKEDSLYLGLVMGYVLHNP
ncbi:hypothetical protein [Maribellus sediminis]|uniref:hypothetical protein n=1 Tax=Maribellus sediminis TaxID=2696285 RepID=UPI0014302B3B|nr:hypothetical protein [Maribellus sediminis]